LNTGRTQHSATLLKNGDVLVAAGVDSSYMVIASAELYDPSTATWSNTSSLHTARFVQTAALLKNGDVLVVGGGDVNNQVLASTELHLAKKH